MTTTPINTGINSPPNERIPAKTLGQQDFMKLLFTMLQHQDPLKPQDMSTMLSNMSNMGMIQSMTTMQQGLSEMRINQQLNLGQSLINKNVQVTDANGDPVTGAVSQVNLLNGVVNLLINGQDYPISNLQAVLS